jgi:arginase
VARHVAVLGAPSAIGLVPDEQGCPRRVDLAPEALRAQELVERLGARDAGDVGPAPRYRDIERPAGRCRNEDDVSAYARSLAQRIAACRRNGELVVLLGGDCSIILGVLLGLRAVEPVPPGLIYVDAHADFASLDESPSGSACSMALALAVGRDDQRLAQLRDDGSLIRAEQVAHVGRRDEGRQLYGDAALVSAGVLDLPMSALRSQGPAEVAQRAVARATAHSDGFWVHVDVDVLDPDVMPATGDPAAGGMDFAEATALLKTLVGDPNALGLQLTLYDPTLDRDGKAAADLAQMLERAWLP